MPRGRLPPKPLDSRFEALDKGNGSKAGKERVQERAVCLRVPDVAGSRLQMLSLQRRPHQHLKSPYQLEQADARPKREVHGRGAATPMQERLGEHLDNASHIREVPRLSSIAEDREGRAIQCGLDEHRHHGCVRMSRRLQGTEDVEEAKGKHLQPERVRVGQRVGLGREFARGVRAHGPGTKRLRLGQLRVRSVDGGGRCQDHVRDLGPARRFEDLQSAGHVDFVRRHRVRQRTGNRSSRSQVDDRICTVECAVQGGPVEDTSLDELDWKALEVLPAAGGKVVKNSDLLHLRPCCELTAEVRPDEARPTGHCDDSRAWSRSHTSTLDPVELLRERRLPARLSRVRSVGSRQRSRILVVAQDFPWPIVTGSLIRLTHVLSALGMIGEIDLFCFVHEDRDDPCEVPPDVSLNRVTSAVYRERGFGPVRRAQWLASRGPVQLVTRDYTAARSKFARWASDHYDLAWFSKAHTYEALGRPRLGPTIVDLDDLEDRKILAFVEAAQRHGDRFDLRSWASTTQARLNARRWEHLQRSIADSVDTVTVCSVLDASRVGVPNGRVVPNGYPEPRQPVGHTGVLEPPTVLFAGLLFYPPNADGAQWLVREVGPHLRQLVPEARLRLVGSPDPRVRELDDPPRTTVVGRVQSMEPELAGADLVAVPIRFGSGTRVKILEAFAHRIPVVSTTLGAEGLGTVNEEHLLLADTAEEFAHCCMRLLTDENLRVRLVDSAEVLYRSRHRWSQSRDIVLQLAGEHLDTNLPRLR